MVIESTQNPKIKSLIKLQQKSRERKKQGLFVVEGVQENELAIKSGYQPQSYYVLDQVFQNQIELPIQAFSVAKQVYETIGYRDSTEGLIGVYQQKKIALESLKHQPNNLYVVLESIEKPGNLGAILRTCDGAGVKAVFICDERADVYNPNTVRSSVGTVFTNQIIQTKKENIAKWLQQNKVHTLATYLRKDTANFYDVKTTESTAYVFGTEATGLSDFWLAHANKTIKIPMQGLVDSLNVSNAVAVCLYEFVRQQKMLRNNQSI